MDDILAEFVKIGVSGATILDSQGMASHIVNSEIHGISLFASFKKLLEDARPYNKTIFTVLESEELVEKTVAVIQNVIGDDLTPGVGFMFSIPIAKTYPMSKSE